MIEHTTYSNGENGNADSYFAFLNALLSSYEWETGSEVTGSQWNADYGKYYFTKNSYIKIYSDSSSLKVKIDLVTPNVATTVFSGSSTYRWTSIGKTSKGICICAYSGSSGSRSSPRQYNLYVGEVKTLDGTTAKGCIYLADDNSYTVATDSGISTEAKFTSTIDSTKKTCLIPAADSTTGAVFQHIFMMKNSPLNYNALKLEDTQKIYLCGKAICLED